MKRLLVAVSFVAVACHQATPPKTSRPAEFDYQVTLGREIAQKHCVRCHDPRSTAERVSNHDNLSTEAHSFTEPTTSKADVVAIVTRGGAGVGKSPEMPPYSPMLTASEIEAVAAYIISSSGSH